MIPAASAASLRAFLLDNVEPGATVFTDGWTGYPGDTKGLYTHHASSISAFREPAHEALATVHLVFSLVKRWLMGTMQGSVSPEHLQAYFDEWMFRFNRRRSRSRGLIFYKLMSHAIDGNPLPYADLRKTGRTRPAPTTPPSPRTKAPSLNPGDPGRPWRKHAKRG